jgi:hypothetical protein
MAKRLAYCCGAAGFLLVIVGGALPHFAPWTSKLLGQLPDWLVPLGLTDMTSAPWWSTMLWGALENGLLYAALGLVLGLAAIRLRRLVYKHRTGTAKD